MRSSCRNSLQSIAACRSWTTASVALLALVSLVIGCLVVSSRPTGVRLSAQSPSLTGPGSIAHVQHLPDLDSRDGSPGGRAARVSYRSTDAQTGESTEVSGTVLVPGGVAPAGGWPVVAFGPEIPATDCVTRSATPALAEPVVAQYLSHGYAVAYSGYQQDGGLRSTALLDSGTAGLNIIDSVRALRSAFPDVSSRWAAIGVAQGGTAVWEANARASEYAPDLQLVGAVALSPTADMTALATSVSRGSLPHDQAQLVQGTLASLTSQPPSDANAIAAERDRSPLARCVPPLEQVSPGLDHVGGGLDFVPPPSATVARLHDVLQRQSVAGRLLSAPLSVVYGLGDTLVDPEWTGDAIRRTCAFGSTVSWQRESGTGRTDDDQQSQIDWIADRFAGKAPQNDCRSSVVSSTGAGQVVRSDDIPSVAAALPAGAHAARVFYRSTEGDTGLPTVVSGAVFSPAGTPPPGGWPVMAYAHGTTGIDPACGLSPSDTLLGQISLVAEFVKTGFAVALPDYQGLGAPGTHPYLDARTAGLNIIDSVRALHSRFPDTSARWGAIGHSQGGGAVWAADEQARVYAPELDLVGAVAFAPAASVSGLVDKAGLGTLTTDQIPAFASVLTSLGRLHPDLDLDNYRRGAAAQHWDALSACAGGLLPERAAVLPQVRSQDLAAATPQAYDEVHRLLTRWELPQRPLSAPMSVLYGSADQLIDAGWTTDALDRACAMGDSITFREQAGGTHSELDLTGQLPWLGERFAGLAATTDCR